MNTSNTKEVQSLKKTNQDYTELLSTLPIDSSGRFCHYNGFWYPMMILEGILSVQDSFLAKPTDILLSSTMKTGTTWLKSLAFSITTRKKFENASSPLLTTMPHECIPFLEVDLVPDSQFERDQELPLIATHMPYTSLPRSIISSDCKIVYIYRDPKDAFVSLWHFVRKVIPQGEKSFPLNLIFDDFVKGASPYGPFWDHVLSYWQASLERPGKVLLLKYEDLKMDTELYVKKLADFLGYGFSAEEVEEGVVEKMVKMCSFENLSNLDVNKTGKHRVDTPMAIDNSCYFRKGEIGDWKNYLTAEMAEEIDTITKEKFGSCGL